MKLGIVSAIYDGFSFEEMIDDVKKNGCSCVEVACWPQGKAERRYAGVSHIDVDNTSAEYIEYIKSYCKNARLHAKKTHNSEENYKKLMEIYATIKE